MGGILRDIEGGLMDRHKKAPPTERPKAGQRDKSTTTSIQVYLVYQYPSFSSNIICSPFLLADVVWVTKANKIIILVKNGEPRLILNSCRLVLHLH